MADVRGDTAGLAGDVVVNGTRYPLALDPRSQQLVWAEGDAINMQDGDPGIPVSAEWADGVPGGMGETKRQSRNSDGCAFATLDTSNHGFWRLPPRKITATPSQPPTDNPTFGFEDQLANGFISDAGQIISPAATGNQVVSHSLGVVPKAIILWSSGRIGGAGNHAHGGMTIGFTDLTTSRCVSIAMRDGVTPTRTGKAMQNVLFARVDDSATPAIVDSVTYVASSATDTTFTINWGTSSGAAILVNWMAIGGADVSAKVVEWAVGSAYNGDTAVTGAGFVPDVCIHASVNFTGAAPTGAQNTANLSFGVMDGAGNQWFQYLYSKDNVATSVSSSFQSASGCIGHTPADPTVVGDMGWQAFKSMDADGFTTTRNTAGGLSSVRIATLCLKGITATAGSFTKSTTTARAIQAVACNPATGIIVASDNNALAFALNPHLSFSLGASTRAGVGQTSAATYDQNGVATSNSYRMASLGAVYEKLTNTDGSTSDALGAFFTGSWTGTGFSIDFNPNDAVPSEIFYLLLRPLVALGSSGTNYVYLLQGRYSYKCSVTTNAITVEHVKDFGAAAALGHPVKFGTDTYSPRWFLPVGDSMNFYRLEFIGTGSTDTWTQDSSLGALAFTATNQGANPALVRAHSGYKVDQSTDGQTFGDDFAVGDSSTKITSMEDSGTTLFVAKEDNLYDFDTGGVARQLTRYQRGDKASTYGAGLMVPSGTGAAYYNHKGLHFYNGNQAIMVGPDALDENRSIPNVTFEPHRVTHMETLYASDEWLYAAFKVTESSTTKTYISAGQRGRGGITWHGFDRFDGVAHLAIIDSQKRLWFTDTTAATIGYYMLGADGSPDAGRDAIGYGAADTTYSVIYPREDFGFPHTLKQLRGIEVKAWNTGTTVPIQLKAYRDGGASANVGTTITTGTVNKRYWTLNTDDTCYDMHLEASITTTPGYVNTVTDGSELRVLSTRVHAFLRPDGARKVRFQVDTRKTYSNGAMPIDDGKTMNDTIKALERGAPVAFTDPDGNTGNIYVTGVTSKILEQEPAQNYLIDVDAITWVNS